MLPGKGFGQQMQVKNFLTGDINNFSMSEISVQAGREWNEDIWRTTHGRVERIISAGYASPQGFWYDQAEDEFVIILQGRATIQWDNGIVHELQNGDWLVIPAHQRHRVDWTSAEPPCVWLCVFFGAELKK